MAHRKQSIKYILPANLWPEALGLFFGIVLFCAIIPILEWDEITGQESSQVEPRKEE